MVYRPVSFRNVPEHHVVDHRFDLLHRVRQLIECCLDRVRHYFVLNRDRSLHEQAEPRWLRSAGISPPATLLTLSPGPRSYGAPDHRWIAHAESTAREFQLCRTSCDSSACDIYWLQVSDSGRFTETIQVRPRHPQTEITTHDDSTCDR